MRYKNFNRVWIVSILLITVLLGCGKKEETPLDYSWSKVEKNSNGTTVNFYMYGGASEVNSYIDNVVAPRLKELNNITLNRVPVSNIRDTVGKLVLEKKAGKNNGTIDLLWVNGENFKELKDEEVLWGQFTGGLPNMELVDPKTYEKDFGERVDGLEVPWGESQFNFITNSGKVPFVDADSLMEYAKKNKGKFTYPAIPDHTGSAFVRNIAIDILGYEDVADYTNEGFKMALNEVWDYLNELKKYQWRQGKTYPENEGKLDLLFSSGEIDVTMGYTINKVSSKVESGVYPLESKSFLLDKGTLKNNHYLTIPYNGSNKWGALYVINYLISEEGQLSKADPKNWGDSSVLDFSKLDSETVNKFESLKDGDRVPTLINQRIKQVPELSPAKLKIIEEGWLKNVGQK